MPLTKIIPHINMISLLYGVIIITSCTKPKNPNPHYDTEIRQIEIERDSLIFEFDGFASPYSTNIQAFCDSSNYNLTYLNDGKIHFVDYYKKQPDRLWNKVMTSHQFDSYSIINKDSVYLLNKKRKELYLYDLKGDFKKKHDLNYQMTTDSTIHPYPESSTTMPIVAFNGEIYLTGKHVGEFAGETKKRKAIAKHNTSTNNTTFLADLPTLYNDYNWGSTYFYFITSAYNPQTKNIVVNFPNSHNLYIYDLINKKSHNVYAGSYKIKQIEPYSKQKDDFIDSNKRLEYYIMQPSYVAVYYDKYKDVYYRLAALPMEKQQIKNPDFWEKRKYQIIILDNTFKQISEISISNIIPENAFINENGLHIQNFSNDAEMKYQRINVKHTTNGHHLSLKNK